MASVKFVRNIRTARYGTVTAGDTVDVSDDDAARYVFAGWAEPGKPPVKKAAAKKTAAEPMVAEADD